MSSSPFLALDPPGRRRALLQACLAIAAIGAVDLVVAGGDPGRAAVWGGWLATFLAGAALVTRGSPRITQAVSLVTSIVAVVALVLLAAGGGGSASPYFLLAAMVPLLSVVFAPDDAGGAGLQGATVLVAGLLLQAGEGAGASQLVLFGAVVVVVTASALVASLGHRRRIERLLDQQARASRNEVELERARQRADRWASIGKLAEGVAHDVNSPLGSLRSNLAFVREELAEGRGQGRELGEAIEDSLQALERIRETVASLRAISVPEAAPGPEAKP